VYEQKTNQAVLELLNYHTSCEQVAQLPQRDCASP